MQVILLEKISRLGNLGDLVNVKSGYARNFLIPQKKAQPATTENIAAFEKIRKELAAKESALLKQAQDKKDKIDALRCVIKANVSEEGRLFGSVGTNDIVEAMAALGYEIERKDVQMPAGVIREVGEYAIDITLYSDITASVVVVVESAKPQ